MNLERPLVVKILVGTIRRGRKSHPVAEYLQSGLAGRCTAEMIDLADYPLPLLEERRSEAEALPPARALLSQIAAGDGLLIVAPEYKGGVPGVLKNAFDHLPQGFLKRTPVGICTVSAGSYGGVACLGQLRLLVLACGGVPIPDALAVSNVGEVLGAEGAGLERALAGKLDRFFAELLWYTEALTRQREWVGERATG